MAVKKFTDVHLSESDLDWVILRPGTLLDVPGTGKVRTGLAIPYGDVPRDDVGVTLLEIIEHPAVTRNIIELTEGANDRTSGGLGKRGDARVDSRGSRDHTNK